MPDKPPERRPSLWQLLVTTVRGNVAKAIRLPYKDGSPVEIEIVRPDPLVKKSTFEIVKQYYRNQGEYFGALLQGGIQDPKLLSILQKYPSFAQDFVVKFCGYAKQDEELSTRYSADGIDPSEQEEIYHAKQASKKLFLAEMLELLSIVPLYCHQDFFYTPEEEANLALFEERLLVVRDQVAALRADECHPDYVAVFQYILLYSDFQTYITNANPGGISPLISSNTLKQNISQIALILKGFSRARSTLSMESKGAEAVFTADVFCLSGIFPDENIEALLSSIQKGLRGNTPYHLFLRDLEQGGYEANDGVAFKYLRSPYDEGVALGRYESLQAYYDRPMYDDIMRGIEALIDDRKGETMEFADYLRSNVYKSPVELDVYNLLSLSASELQALLSGVFQQRGEEMNISKEKYFAAFQGVFFESFEHIESQDLLSMFPDFPRGLGADLGRFRDIQHFASWLAMSPDQIQSIHGEGLLPEEHMARANILKLTLAWSDIPIIQKNAHRAKEHRTAFEQHLLTWIDKDIEGAPFEQSPSPQKPDQWRYKHSNGCVVYFELGARVKGILSVLVKLGSDPKYSRADSIRDLSGLRIITTAFAHTNEGWYDPGAGKRGNHNIRLYSEYDDKAILAMNSLLFSVSSFLEPKTLIYKSKGLPENRELHKSLLEKLNKHYPHLRLENTRKVDATKKTDKDYRDQSFCGYPRLPSGSSEGAYSDVRAEVQIMSATMKYDIEGPAHPSCYNLKKLLVLQSRKNRIIPLGYFYKICESNLFEPLGINKSGMNACDLLKILIHSKFLQAYRIKDSSQIILSVRDFSYRIDEMRGDGRSIRDALGLELLSDGEALIPQKTKFDENSWKSLVQAYQLNTCLNHGL